MEKNSMQKRHEATQKDEQSLRHAKNISYFLLNKILRFWLRANGEQAQKWILICLQNK